MSRRRSEPRKQDVTSIDAIIRALYESICFEPGGQPDWERLRSLFSQGARLVKVSDDGTEDHDFDTFFGNVREQLASGELRSFDEREIHRHVDEYIPIAHVFSTYEAREAPSDDEPLFRGVNSIQLRHEADRWWVVTVLWVDESPSRPIPLEHLPREE